jgi:hypothetical protein
MSVVTNKIIVIKAIIISFKKNTIFKRATLILKMYCGLHFQFLFCNFFLEIVIDKNDVYDRSHSLAAKECTSTSWISVD